MAIACSSERKLRVCVETPARLHLGLLDLNGRLGRLFGGIGVALNYPNVILEMESSKNLDVRGEESTTVRSYVERFLKTYHIDEKVSVDVKRTISRHVGLGSGTQLALALATALAKVFQLEVSVRELAIVMGRGVVSGIGTAVFEYGGFIVEGGSRIGEARPLTKKSFPPIISHNFFPEDWIFVVAVPAVRRGFTDEEELLAFKQLPPAPEEEVGEVCRLVLMKLLPSIIESNIEDFGSALTQIQNISGGYFAKVQGGTYSSSVAKECIERMAKLGAYGVGQSSWGPAVYGLAHGEKQAIALKSDVQAFLDAKTSGQLFISKANNRGANIEIVKD